MKYTSLHRKRAVPHWKDVDATAVRVYFGLLLVAGVYRPSGEETCSLLEDKTGLREEAVFVYKLPLAVLSAVHHSVSVLFGS